jgi:hypothetical protein
MNRSLRFGLVVTLLAGGSGFGAGAFESGLGLASGAGWAVAAPMTQDPAAEAPAATADGYLTDTVPRNYDLTGLDSSSRDDRQKITTVRTARSEVENRVTTALSSANALSAADQELVRNWVGQVLMAEMTSLNAEAQTRLGDMRQELFRKYIRATSNDNNRNFLLNSVVLPKATDVASKNYHPAARVNAALVIGQMDSVEGISGQRPPRPNLRALGALLTLIDDPQTPEYLVAACLSGVQRHAEIDGQMPARERMQVNARQQLADSMLKILNKYQTQQTEAEPGYLLSRRAMQTLAALNMPENDPQVVSFKQMANQIADNAQAGKWLRLDAMMAMSKFPLDEPVAYLERLGRLVVWVSKVERAQVLDAQKLLEIDKLIKDKTGLAMAKKKPADSSGLPADGPAGMGAGAAGAALGDKERMGGGGGSMGGGFMDLSGFDESGLFPYHLHYARTNIKVVAAAALEVLGTRGRTPSGLKVALANNADATKLIDLLDRELKKLLSVTDIGLVEEKPLTEAQRRSLDPQDLVLLDQSNSVRVLAGVGKSILALEKMVGAVDVPGATGSAATEVAVSVTPPPAVEAGSQATESDEAAAGETADGQVAEGGDQAETTEATQGNGEAEGGSTAGEAGGGR